MKIIVRTLFALYLMVCIAVLCIATTDTANQTVSITFSEISEIAASGNPGLITIVAPATPGDLPADQTEATTTMAWTANVGAGTTRKITGQIDALFPGILLYTTFADPGTGGTSEGKTEFVEATTDYDFVTAIGNCNVSAIGLTFTAEVSAMVAPYTNTQQIITWTLTEDI